MAAGGGGGYMKDSLGSVAGLDGLIERDKMPFDCLIALKLEAGRGRFFGGPSSILEKDLL